MDGSSCGGRWKSKRQAEKPTASALSRGDLHNCQGFQQHFFINQQNFINQQQNFINQLWDKSVHFHMRVCLLDTSGMTRAKVIVTKAAVPYFEMFAVFMIFTALESEVFTLLRRSAFTGSKSTHAACYPASKTFCSPRGWGRLVLRVHQAISTQMH